MNDLNELLRKLGKNNAGTVAQNDFNFFKDHSAEGVFSISEYKDYIDKSPSWHIRNLKILHDNMKLNRKLNAEPSLQAQNGEEFIWCRFGYGNLRQNIRILNKGNMYDFIMNYAQGKIRNVKSLEELVAEIVEE